MIKLEHVSKKYGKTDALSDINMELCPGEIVVILGENGAGKSTLMKSILGYVTYKGSITLEGEKISHKNIYRISYATCEHSFFPGLTPENHREFYKEQFPAFREKRFYTLMDFFQLPMEKKLRSFSTGQKNQFEVIMALSQGADYILMDEPFAENDVFNRQDFYKVLVGVLEPEETILLSTHLIREVSSFVNRAVFLQKGRIIGDITTDQLEDEQITLLDYTKSLYQYKEDRVMQVLHSIEEKGV